MADRNWQLINNSEAFMAEFCQYKCMLPFIMLILTATGLQETCDCE